MKLIHEIYWRFYKDNCLQKQRRFRSLSLIDMQKIQWKRLKKLLDYVYANNKFYRSYFNSVNLTPKDIATKDDFAKLPINDKSIYKMNCDLILSEIIDQNSCFASCTSGSTGEPLQFYSDLEIEMPNLSASYLLNRESMATNPFNKINILEIKAKPRNEITNLKQLPIKKRNQSLREIFLSTIYGLNAHKINSKNINEIIELFRSLNINAIHGYASSTLLLASLFESLNISFNLKYIMTIGEGCSDSQKKFISKIFNCHVFRDYSSSECLHMGCECISQKGYHLDLFNYFFEFINNGTPVDYNEPGDIVVTNLNNYAFPFIRYKVGDYAILSDKSCRCGSNLPIAKHIYGRSSDIIKTPSGKELTTVFITVPFKYYYEYIRQFQIIQIDDNNLLVKIKPTRLMKIEVLNDIKNTFYDFLERSIEVNIEIVDEIEKARTGKTKVMITKDEYQMNQNSR